MFILIHADFLASQQGFWYYAQNSSPPAPPIDTASAKMDWFASGRSDVHTLWAADWFFDQQAQMWSFWGDGFRCAGMLAPTYGSSPPEPGEPGGFGGYVAAAITTTMLTAPTAITAASTAAANRTIKSDGDNDPMTSQVETYDLMMGENIKALELGLTSIKALVNADKHFLHRKSRT